MPTSLSRKILIALMIIFILTLFQVWGMTYPYVLLIPQNVVPGMEVWRVLSYPLAIINFGGFIIAGISFSTPGEELESMLGTNSFAAHLIAVTVLAGLLHLVAFNSNSRIPMGGPENAALFVYTGFLYLYPKSEIRLLFFNIRTSTIYIVLALAVLIFAVFDAIELGNPLILFSMGGFGLVFGWIYFHIRFQKYPVLLKQIRTVERAFTKKQKPNSAVTVRQQQARKAPSSVSLKSRLTSSKRSEAIQEELTDEERLDTILDRISAKGYDSLSKEDRDFLTNYSSKL